LDYALVVGGVIQGFLFLVVGGVAGDEGFLNGSTLAFLGLVTLCLAFIDLYLIQTFYKEGQYRALTRQGQTLVHVVKSITVLSLALTSGVLTLLVFLFFSLLWVVSQAQ
jgi:hypothetical protein